MKSLSFFKGTNLYLLILTLIGFGLTFFHITFPLEPDLALTLLLIGAIAIFNYYMIIVPPKGNYLSMDSSIYLAIIFLYGLELPLAILFLSSIIFVFFDPTKMPFWKHLFNFSIYAIMITGSYYSFIFLGGDIGLVNKESSLAYFLALISYFLINIMLVGMYFLIDSLKSALSIVKLILKESVVNYIITLALAIIFAMLLGSYPIFGTIIFTLVIVMLSVVFTKYFRLYEGVLHDKKTREQILNSLPVGVITFDDKTSEFSINSSAKQLLKLESNEIKKLANSRYDLENDSFWKIVFSDQIVQNEKIIYKNGNDTYYILLVSQSELIDSYDHLVGRIFHFIDITDEEERDNRMRQSEKLAVLGESAARAAHEIRNPLAVIHGFMSLMKQKSEEESKELHVPLMLKELDRINAIIEEMLMMAKPGAPILKLDYMEDVINEILPLYRRSSITQKIQFNVNIKRIPLLLDSKQMTQVLHNLIRNSCEAMGHTGLVSIYSQVNDRSYRLFINDSGPGIPKNIQNNIFEPFHSNKESGTGLGLTIVQRIIENHNGTIELYSSSAEGTTFLISLPLEVWGLTPIL